MSFPAATRQKKYERIAERISQMICEGDYTPGDRLPAVSKLSEFFEVNAATIFKALDTLEGLDIIERIHRKGTFIKSIPADTEAEVAKLPKNQTNNDHEEMSLNQFLTENNIDSFYIGSCKTIEFIVTESKNPISKQYWDRIVTLAEKQMVNTQINLSTPRPGRDYSKEPVDLIMDLLPMSRFINHNFFMHIDKKNVSTSDWFGCATDECVKNDYLTSIPFSLIPACEINNDQSDIADSEVVSPDFINYIFFTLDVAKVNYRNDDGTINIANSESRTLLQACRNNYQKYLKILAKEPAIRSDEDFHSLTSLLARGTVKKMNFFTYAFADLANKNTVSKLRISPITWLPKKKVPVITSAIQVVRDSKEVERASEFATLAASTEAQKIMAEYPGNIPVSKTAAMDKNAANFQFRGYEKLLASLTGESYYSYCNDVYRDYTFMGKILKMQVEYFRDTRPLESLIKNINAMFSNNSYSMTQEKCSATK